MRSDWLTGGLLCLPEQVAERDIESVRQLHYRRDTRASLAPLDPADVVAMDAGLKAQRLLRETSLLACSVECPPKALQNTIRLRHGSHGFRRDEIALQPDRVPADNGPVPIQTCPFPKGAVLSASTSPPQSPPAGWYNDPEGSGQRWWDGGQWTEHVQPGHRTPGAPPAPVPPSPGKPSRRGHAAVAVAALILVGAIAAAFLLLSGGSSTEQQRAADEEAKSKALTAQIALETYATDHEGSYTGATTAALQGIEATIPDDLEVTATDDTYTLTVPSAGDSNFTISRSSAWGFIERSCEMAGEGGCPISGEWK